MVSRLTSPLPARGSPALLAPVDSVWLAMTRTGATAAAPEDALARRFEAIVFVWESAAVRGSDHGVADLRELIEEACVLGLDLAIVVSERAEDVDRQLGARPAGPGELLLADDGASELYRAGRGGLRLLGRRDLTCGEAAPTRPSSCVRWIMQRLWRRGIAPSQVLTVEDRQGAPDGLSGDDPRALLHAAGQDAAVSIGADAYIPPAGATALGGNYERLVELLVDQVARRRAGEPPVADGDPEWTVEVDGRDPLLLRVHESLLTIADGRIGTRGSSLTGDPGDDPSVLLAGVYAGEGPETHLLPAPRWNTLALRDGAGLSLRRVLDLHAGTLSQELAGGDAGSSSARALELSSLARPGTAVLRVRGSGAPPALQPGLVPPAEAERQSGVEEGCTWMRVNDPHGSIVAASHERVLDGSTQDPTPGWTLERVACYAGTQGGEADEGATLASVRAARALGFEALLCEHRRAWAERWRDADVLIAGDAELQRAVRFAIFHLLANVAETGEATVGARGLTGQAYRGHVFWDSDVYVLPFLAATRPRAARAMLEYRIRRLPAALRAARASGQAGARFPWESAAGGEDVTPTSATGNDGEAVPILTGSLEQHVTADVAWAACCYADWTGDQAFAQGPGLELLVQTARWWASRIETDDHGSGHIRDVIGPDEYHEHVDDNAFTNVMARWNLRRAAHAARGHLDDEERRRWQALAEALVDGYDTHSGVYEQFSGFFALEPLIIAELAPRRPVAADRLLGAERVAGAQVVKQADVLMLHYLVPEELVTGSLAANLAFYEPRTAHGSTLSPGVHAALLARAGRPREALELLRLTANIDLQDIGQVTAGGLHMAAMGSVWRALAFGFAGLQAADDALVVDPVAVPGLEVVELQIRFRGSRVRLRIAPDGATIRAEPPLNVRLPGHEPLKVGAAEHSFELSATPGNGTR